MSVIEQDVMDQKRAEVDFENVWRQLCDMEWHELKEACRYAYNQGRAAGKSQGIRLIVESAKQLEQQNDL